MAEKQDRREACIDIECTNLSADFGIILCVGIKEVGVETPTVIRLDDSPNYRRRKWDDTALCKKVASIIRDYKVVYTWNGTRFDIPYLTSRFIANGLEPLPIRPHGEIKHKDLIYAARHRLRLSGNSLESVSSFLGVSTDKTKITPQVWVKALTGNRECMDYIVDHCARDVIITEEVKNRILKLSPSIK